MPAHSEPRAAVRAPFTHRLAHLTGQQATTGATILQRRFSQWLMLCVCWLCVVCALVRPQWLEEPVVRELPMRDLLLAIDLTGSMDTQDFTDDVGNTVRPRLELYTWLLAFLLLTAIAFLAFQELSNLQMRIAAGRATATDAVR